MHTISGQAVYQLVVLGAAVLVAPVVAVAEQASVSSNATRPSQTHESPLDVPQPDRRAPTGRRITKADLLTSLEEGFSETLIVETIRRLGVDFDVTVATMVELKQAGASDQVLEALLAQVQPSPSSPVAHSEPENDMVLIPAGEFTMGLDDGKEDAAPAHRVYLDAFYIDRHEVTNAEYEKFDPAHKEARAFDCNDCPVTNVSWSDAAAFATWAGKRLPTEAEWEKATRGPGGYLYGYGDEYQKELAHVEAGVATLVETYPPNGYGLFDALGNVWEWSADYYTEDYYRNSPQRNPTGPPDGRGRVVRGGSYNNDEKVHLAVRTWSNPRYRYRSIGFRCARDARTRER